MSHLPPRRIRKGISPLWFDFADTGEDQLQFLVELCGLQPSHRVLDIGCGVGRLALPLSGYLNDKGAYEGFDVLDHMVDWCKQNIGSRHPNFQFRTAAVASTTGSTFPEQTAADYRFPYEDNSFDLAYAGSLFTHLTPAGTENYLAEVLRTLRPGGVLVATFNLYNAESHQRFPGRRLEEIWPHDHGAYRLKEEDSPESSVAYDEIYLRKAYEKVGLTILEPFRPDASYSAIRAPKHGNGAPHLWYTTCVIAVPA
ncbi:methyltransferase domain-containing protein [Actinopolymorpha rutila]|uniref:SAM-dependent methyltransferase n=1 Tax=Actinopolymorpha rutila TaxID=446787 RepID=A0A852ZM64_9ACTN|nr:SAM-dependent methyltransferase [Actinopolymorpha rutila]